jgi:hypothetical protein
MDGDDHRPSPVTRTDTPSRPPLLCQSRRSDSPDVGEKPSWRGGRCERRVAAVSARDVMAVIAQVVGEVESLVVDNT